jgi:hypothetical protein
MAPGTGAGARCSTGENRALGQGEHACSRAIFWISLGPEGCLRAFACEPRACFAESRIAVQDLGCTGVAAPTSPGRSRRCAADDLVRRARVSMRAFVARTPNGVGQDAPTSRRHRARLKRLFIPSPWRRCPGCSSPPAGGTHSKGAKAAPGARGPRACRLRGLSRIWGARAFTAPAAVFSGASCRLRQAACAW